MADPYYISETTLTAEEEIYLRIAANIVQRLAPLDTELTGETLDDYEVRAADAEYLVWTWLINTTGGSITSDSVAGLSASYTQFAVVREMVSGAMGDYYVDAAGSANLGYIEDFR